MQNLKLSLQLVTRVERLISDKLNDAENGAAQKWKVQGLYQQKFQHWPGK